MNNHFEHLFVFGRPAGGKSEFIDYMKKCEPNKRLDRFFIAPFDILDDYLFLTEIATHEDALQACGEKRFMTTRTNDGIAVINDIFWPYASKRLNVTIQNNYLSRPQFYRERSLLIEFSRGTGDWSYKKALTGLDREVLAKGAIIYINVRYEEALRRNEARYQEKLKHSILAHKCPEHIMEKYYKYDDWLDITQNRPSGRLEINGVKVPFVTMENEPESKDNDVLETRYGGALKTLFSTMSYTAPTAS
jgi:hypothetical protein